MRTKLPRMASTSAPLLAGLLSLVAAWIAARNASWLLHWLFSAQTPDLIWAPVSDASIGPTFFGGSQIVVTLLKKLDGYFALLFLTVVSSYFAQAEMRKLILISSYIALITYLFGPKTFILLAALQAAFYLLTAGMSRLRLRIDALPPFWVSVLIYILPWGGPMLCLLLWTGLGGLQFSIPIGVQLFLWQFPRLLLYYYEVTSEPGSVKPRFRDYLIVFWSIADLNPWAIGQGYHYIQSRFLSRDKGKIALDGCKILILGLAYPLIGAVFVLGLSKVLLPLLGFEAFPSITVVFESYLHDPRSVSRLAILVASLVFTLKFYFAMAAQCHIKVGFWRLMGFDVESHFNHVWKSVNFVDLWNRYAIHYKEIVMKVFFLPGFSAFRRFSFALRFSLAASYTILGGLVYFSIARLFVKSLADFESFSFHVKILPYFIVLLFGFLASSYLPARRPPRKPWTPDRFILLDLTGCLVTIQTFSLMQVFVLLASYSSASTVIRFLLQAFRFA